MIGDAVVAATVSMDRMYRHQRHIYDFTRKYYLLGRDHLIEQLRPGRHDSVLEIGCGTARNLIVAARRYPETAFFGVDVSTAMLTSAHQALARAGLSTRVRVAHGDATSFDPVMLFGKATFERVFMAYSLSMIPDWCTAVEHAVSLLTTEGQLQIVDFGGQEALPGLLRAALRNWLAHFDVHPRDELETKLQSYAGKHNATLVMHRPYNGYAQYAKLAFSRISTSADLTTK